MRFGNVICLADLLKMKKRKDIKMKNPWEEIDLSDYENHMKQSSVMQLQCLNNMMKIQFDLYPIESVTILGVAGGNGLEHVDTNKIKKVYGVDINRKYLNECAERYKNSDGVFEFICTDLTDDKTVIPCADMIMADLLIEYIGYECFKNIVVQAKPVYVSCVVQVNTDSGFVSESPYIHAFDELDKVHHQIDENGLTETMKGIDYIFISNDEQELPNGKKLVRLDYKRKIFVRE